jgi:transposase-like protein
MNNKIKTLSNDQQIIQEIIQSLYGKKPLSGPDGAITKLIKHAMEVALDGECDAHMLENKLEEAGNRRNGRGIKTVKTNYGTFELETPRDRDNSFEPQLVKKRQTVITDEIDSKILSLYGYGTSYNDISQHISDMYGLSVSNATISAITDKLLPEIMEWRSRPLDRIYPIIFLDAMFFKAREDGRVITKVMYNVMGVNMEGRKEILGFYFCESEGASFWLGVLNDLKSRGIEDILIACIDGLKGFPESIGAAFPKCEIQLCVVHQIRSSLRLVASKDQKQFMKDLKQVYQATNKEIAESKLFELGEKYAKYYAAIKPWINNWEQLSTYFKYSEQIRKLIYTTNPIGGFHRQIRKFTKTKAAFTNENSLSKLVFCAINKITTKWSQPLHNWALAITELDIHFPNRLDI